MVNSSETLLRPIVDSSTKIRVQSSIGVRVQIGTMLIMQDQVLTASGGLTIITEPNRVISNIRANGLVVSLSTADYKVGGSSPGLGISFSIVILIGNELELMSRWKAIGYKTRWLRGNALDHQPESRERGAGSNPVRCDKKGTLTQTAVTFEPFEIQSRETT